MEEIRKDVVGFEGLYKVSNMGNVVSISRLVYGGWYNSKEKILKVKKDNYLRICLSKEGKTKAYSLHRVIAQAFIPNPENKQQINHKNGNKYDNRIENLEWCTSSENHLHAYKTGLQIGKTNMKGRFGKDNPISKCVLQFDRKLNLIKERDSATNVYRALGYSNSYISACCRGLKNQAYGFIWKYKQ